MNYDYFKDKFITDINSNDELEWLWKNSYMNNYVYYGKKLILNEKLDELEALKKFNPNLYKQLFHYFNLANKYKDLNILTILFKIYYELFIFTGENFEDFISNKNLIKDFAKIYLIQNNIELNIISQVYKKLADSIGLIQGKANMSDKWHLWYYPLVRDLEIESKEGIRLRYILTLAEYGEFEKSYIECKKEGEKIERLRSKNDYPDNISISFYFYLMKLAWKTNRKDAAKLALEKNNEIIENSYKKIDYWPLTLLKMGEVYLQWFVFTGDIYSFRQYKKFFEN